MGLAARCGGPPPLAFGSLCGRIGALLGLAVAACGPPGPREARDLTALFSPDRAGAETAELDLGSDASRDALVSGWGPRSHSGAVDFQWSQGQRSELRFTVGDPRPLALELRGWPLAFPGAPPQTVTVELNGRALATLALAGRPETLRLTLPADALVRGENRLGLRPAWARAPREVLPGASERRPLAVAWDRMRIANARRHGSPGVEPEAPALRLPLGSYADFPVRVPDGSRLRIDALEAYGDVASPVLEVYVETARGATLRAALAPGRGLDLALPPAGGEPLRLSLRALGEAAPDTAAGLRIARPVLDLPAPPAPAATPARTAAPAPNVVVYLIDTLRADRLGAYGDPRPISPRIDAFARDATLFRFAYAQSSWTKPAVASLFTGQLPQAHRSNPRDAALPLEAPLLAELLRAQGFATLGVVTNTNVSRAFGFDRGFDVYEELTEGATPGIHQPSDRANEVAFSLLERRPVGRPFFLYLHTADPHWPYTPREAERRRLASGVADPSVGTDVPLARLERPPAGLPEAVSQLYDAEIAFNDQSFGQLIERLRELSLLDDTVVVLLSDHGEAFFEHGTFRHGTTLFAEEMRIPLVIRFADGLGRGAVVDAPARQIDVLPTVLDAVGAPLPPGLPGRSLLPFVRAGGAPGDATTTFAYLDRGGRVVEAALEDGRKLIRFRVAGRGAPRVALFDLASDPGETRDVADAQPVWRDYLLARLDAAAAAAPAGPPPPRATVEPEMRRRLEALGYTEE